jgi:hypothetical protein
MKGPHRRTRKAWSRAHSKAEKAWLAVTTKVLASEARQRLPGAALSPSSLDQDKLLDSFAELLPPSQVATWAMAAQLTVILGQGTLSRLAGIPKPKLCQLEALRLRLDAAEIRSLWQLWSLILCPGNLANTFHLETWGYFHVQNGLWVKDFEAKRIRGGFADAVFGSTLDFCDAHAVPGVVNYLRGDLKVGMIDPPIAVPKKPGKERIPIAWLEELFERLDRGENQEQVAAAMGVTQAYVSILATQRALVLPHILRTVRTKVRIPKLDGR